ncbi:MAG: hypothetical protein N2515_04145 [Deltaproteobacteria bacterium]|nr:hypothetical protein [Deltaproteobacteria bacterium]
MPTPEVLERGISQLRVRILGAPTQEALSSGITPPFDQNVENPQLFPLLITLVPKQPGERWFEVEANAIHQGATVGSGKVRSRFIQGEVRTVVLWIDGSCTQGCGQNQTCRQGRCSDVFVDPNTLPPFNGRIDGGVETQRDASTDAPADSQFEDGEICPPSDRPPREAIFVSANAPHEGDGSPHSPLGSIQAAINSCQNCVIAIENGEYVESLIISSGHSNVHLLGGFVRSTTGWCRGEGRAELNSPSAIAIDARMFRGNLRIENMVIRARDGRGGARGENGESSIGIWSASGSVEIIKTIIEAGKGGDGGNGGEGTGGSDGGSNCGSMSPSCSMGRRGSDGAAGTAGMPAWSAMGFVPGKGQNGGKGEPGENGVVPSPRQIQCATSCAGDGMPHCSVATYEKASIIGTCGCGGEGGFGGEGGGGGGASVGVLLTNRSARVSLIRSQITAKDGGKGGEGGRGGAGGQGGRGQAGGRYCDTRCQSCSTIPGCACMLTGGTWFDSGPGGQGGSGGAGGAGGGGAGGPSHALVLSMEASFGMEGAVRLMHGRGGEGRGGAPQGEASEIKRYVP